jgi:hypothetical protein
MKNIRRVIKGRTGGRMKLNRERNSEWNKKAGGWRRGAEWNKKGCPVCEIRSQIRCLVAGDYKIWAMTFASGVDKYLRPLVPPRAITWVRRGGDTSHTGQSNRYNARKRAGKFSVSHSLSLPSSLCLQITTSFCNTVCGGGIESPLAISQENFRNS